MNWFQEFWLRARYEWKLHLYWPVIPIGAFMTLWFSGALVPEGNFQPVEARITGFSLKMSTTQRGNVAIVLAKTENGGIGQITVRPAMIAGCEIGDLIEAEQSGLAVRLTARPCPQKDE